MKKQKIKFVKLTMTYTYYGIGKDLEEAKDFAFKEFLSHQSNQCNLDFAYEGNQKYEEVKKEDVSLDDTFIQEYIKNEGE